MNRKVACWALLLLGLAGCGGQSARLQSLSLDYPHGGTRLLVQRSGEAALFYGARPHFQKIKAQTFEIDALYGQLEPLLYANRPREEWPDPKATAGMVVIIYDDREKESYLILDQQEFADRLFERARAAIADQGR